MGGVGIPLAPRLGYVPGSVSRAPRLRWFEHSTSGTGVCSAGPAGPGPQPGGSGGHAVLRDVALIRSTQRGHGKWGALWLELFRRTFLFLFLSK